jgi:hypothetical protein
VCGEQSTSYAWPDTNSAHINIKELQAAVLAFQAFIPRRFAELTMVGFWLDNCVAVHAINKFGSARCESLTALASSLWHEAIKKNVCLQAFYVPGSW